MNIFTIGFSAKNAEDFFSILSKNKIKKLIDIRLNNVSQLAGFSNAKHLPYFLKIHNIEYEYKPELAPSKELLDGYKKGEITWKQYEEVFNKLLISRNILNNISIDELENCVFLCSEPTADRCHRRLTVEYLAKNFNNINIRHL